MDWRPISADSHITEPPNCYLDHIDPAFRERAPKVVSLEKMGDTFIVESRGFNDRTPLDAMGHPRSEAMHVTERFRRRDFGHLDVEMTFDDPQMYSRQFTVRIPFELVPDNDIFEMFCTQNEKDRIHMVK